MKNSFFGKKATALRDFAVLAFVPIWIFIAFSSAIVDSPDSDEVIHQEQTVSNRDAHRLPGIASLAVDEKEKEETEEKNHSDDQKKLENAKVFIPTIVFQFVPRIDLSTYSSEVESEQQSCLKVPLYIAFHSWKTFC